MAFTHAQDPRRPEGGMLTGGRPDGTGYQTQLIQYPVICAADVVDYRPTQGSRAPVTFDRRAVSCPDCRDRL
jgi:hypothetical protein